MIADDTMANYHAYFKQFFPFDMYDMDYVPIKMKEDGSCFELSFIKKFGVGTLNNVKIERGNSIYRISYEKQFASHHLMHRVLSNPKIRQIEEVSLEFSTQKEFNDFMYIEGYLDINTYTRESRKLKIQQII